MNSQTDQTNYSGRQGAAFRFDRRPHGMHVSADLGKLCQQVGDQVRGAVAGIDFEAIGDEVRRAMVDLGNEVREAVDNLNREQPWANSGRVTVEVVHESGKPGRAGASARPAASVQPATRPDPLARERTAVLQMVAEGKITPEQAAQLLDALGG